MCDIQPLAAVQLRDYIHDHLYNAECGYFNKQTAPVAPLPKPLDFASFLGKAAYQKAVQQAYQTLPVSAALSIDWHSSNLKSSFMADRDNPNLGAGVKC